MQLFVVGTADSVLIRAYVPLYVQQFHNLS